VIRKFTDLEVWQIAKQIIIKDYQLLNTFPKDEKFGVVAQGKDAVVSIAANIAEGFGRFHYKDKLKFYYNARGSLEETKSHLLISEALGFISSTNKKLFEEILADLEKLAAKLNSFINSVGKYASDE
jgi:four helix bundle protein